MRHEKALRLLDELDAKEAPGLALRLHLARCPSCARQAALLDRAMGACRSAPPPGGRERASRVDLDERIMAAVRLTPPPRQDFSIADWALPAAVILASICLVSFASDRGYIESILGSGSALYLSLVLGLAFTAYSAMFVASHLAELRTFLLKRGVLPR